MYNVINAMIMYNMSAEKGGGVYCRSGRNIFNGDIISNTATKGGGIYFDSSLNQINGHIIGNSAKFGGGIFFDDNYLTPSYYSSNNTVNSTITGNEATVFGGGICFDHENLNLANLTDITNSTVSGNSPDDINYYEGYKAIKYTDYRYVNEANYISNIEGTEVLRLQDPDGDELGDGTLRLPTTSVQGMYDIHEVVVSADSDYVYFYVSLQSRYYWNLSMYSNSIGGFGKTLIGVFFDNDLMTWGNTNFQLYSPMDGSANLLDMKLDSTNIAVKYGAAMIGGTDPIGGTLYMAYNSGTMGNIKTGPNLTNLEMIRTWADPYTFQGSTVFAFKIPRTGVLSAGDWRIFLYAYDWEDYGLDSSYPGNNGHLREVNTYPGSFAFGCESGDYAYFADILSTNTGRQAEIFQSKIVDKDDFITITLP